METEVKEEAKKLTATDRLSRIVDFDVTKQPSGSQEVLAKVIQKIKQERLDAAEKKAEELLRQALDLNQKRQEARKAFEGQDKKFEKDLGKLIASIEKISKGISPSEETEEKDQENKS